MMKDLIEEHCNKQDNPFRTAHEVEETNFFVLTHIFLTQTGCFVG